jgi:pre-rRNA-processing protein IPI3
MGLHQDQIAVKMVLPEKLSCIAVDQEGRYFAGGTAQGRVYLWEVRLYNDKSAS